MSFLHTADSNLLTLFPCMRSKGFMRLSNVIQCYVIGIQDDTWKVPMPGNLLPCLKVILLLLWKPGVALHREELFHNCTPLYVVLWISNIVMLNRTLQRFPLRLYKPNIHISYDPHCLCSILTKVFGQNWNTKCICDILKSFLLSLYITH